ncbi:hypothetical protein BCR37DRAFT_382737 [Protomyces lactucae-debilis]|uniref:Uncharacterized protein n=1 Tax=Protomyces lactucae-debilis TaxID=2754530 RepID=A0A1Y2F296_PROLT|nr:uncharacterized protein BCR37DRAFT_382737 [Protomyces lactucae-debilis]ORY77827.1 hypothetical protein BCR37DRAFT_382737 [Protomyces lactucae-debilis]
MFINEAFSIRKSESSTSVRSQMWDSSDPQRNPAPLPLPDRDQPVSAVSTQQKISVAHKRLQSSGSSKTLNQDEADSKERERVSSRSLYELLQLVHANLETLMKRSQNNARDLGKLRGDVRNPQVVEDIKRLMQEASAAVQDPAQQSRLDVDLSHKLDELLRSEKVERPPPSQDAKWTNDLQQVLTVLQELQSSLQQLHSRPQEASAAPELHILDKHMESLHAWTSTAATQSSLEALTDAQRLHMAEIQALLQSLASQQTTAHLGLHTSIDSLSASREVDLSALQNHVNSLDASIQNKSAELANLDALLAKKQLVLKDLERRAALMQSSLQGMRQDVYALKEEAAASLKKKTRRPPSVAAPLQQVTNRRIVSLTNMAQPSPFARPLDKLQSPARKSSWSKRVGSLFTANKENTASGLAGHVEEAPATDSRSVRSVSYRG